MASEFFKVCADGYMFCYCKAAQTQGEAVDLRDVSLTDLLALREAPTVKSSIPNFTASCN